jgi:hypothetical protein
MNMILQDIPDYQGAIRKAVAVVRPGGDVVISILHPCFEESASRWPDRNVVETREYLAEFAEPQEVFALRYHRPLSAYINALLDEGLILRRMLEPRLAPEIAAQGNDRDAHVPSFLVLHLQRLAEAGRRRTDGAVQRCAAKTASSETTPVTLDEFTALTTLSARDEPV